MKPSRLNDTGSVLFCLIAALVSPLLNTSQAQVPDNTITGTLRVTGDADLEGNLTTFGAWTGDASRPGLSLGYGETGTTGSITFGIGRSNGSFAWSHRNAADDSWIKAMQLESNHKLHLYPASGSASTQFVILDAAGTSLFSGNVNLGGTDNVMPAQTITGSSSVLTAALADARYLTVAAPTMIWGAGSTTSGTGNSVAFGETATAVGSYGAPGIALGKNARAQSSAWGPFSGIALGTNAVVGNAGDVGGGISIGTNTYTKVHGISMGEGAQSYAYGAASIGQNSWAMGDQSYIFGFNNVVWSNLGLALGTDLKVYGHKQTVIGTMNIEDTSASPNTRVETDNCFVVGNGTGSNGSGTRSNALTIKWNGDATMHGNATVTKSISVAQNALISGNATVTGQVQAATGRFSGKVRLQPQGGLSMGEFIYDPENP